MNYKEILFVIALELEYYDQHKINKKEGNMS